MPDLASEMAFSNGGKGRIPEGRIKARNREEGGIKKGGEEGGWEEREKGRERLEGVDGGKKGREEGIERREWKEKREGVEEVEGGEE